MTIKQFIDLLGSPKHTKITIYKDEEPQVRQLWSGYTYYPNSLLELYYDMKICYFNVANSELCIYAVD